MEKRFSKLGKTFFQQRKFIINHISLSVNFFYKH